MTGPAAARLEGAARAEVPGGGGGARPGATGEGRRPGRPSRLVDKLLGVVVFLLLWQLAADFWVGSKWISNPVQVGWRAWAMLLDGTLLVHAWQTFQEGILGLLVGTAAGIAAGLTLGRYRRVSDAIDPVVMGLYSLPRVSLAPLFIIWLGIGLNAKVALCASIVFFIVLFNVREGVRAVDPDLVDAFRSMNASRGAMMRYVVVPSLTPWLVSAIRIGIGMALIGAVVGEMMGASQGLGWYVTYSSHIYDITGSMMALVALGIMAMLLNALVAWLEKRVLSWRRADRSDVMPPGV